MSDTKSIRKEFMPLQSPYSLFKASGDSLSLEKPVIGKRFHATISGLKHRGIIQPNEAVTPWIARFRLNGRPVVIESSKVSDESEVSSFAISVDQAVCESLNESPRDIAELVMDVLGIGDLKSH